MGRSEVRAVIQLHREPGTEEYVLSPVLAVTVSMSEGSPQPHLSAECSTVEHGMLDFVLRPLTSLRCSMLVLWCSGVA